MLAFAVGLLAEPHGGASDIDVAHAQAEGAFAAGAGLEVETDQQQVEVGVVGRGADGVDEFGELTVVEGAAAARARTGFGQRGGRVGGDRPAAAWARWNSARRAATQVSVEARPVPLGRLRVGPLGCRLDHGDQVDEGDLGEAPVPEVSRGEPPVGAVGGGRRRGEREATSSR